MAHKKKDQLIQFEESSDAGESRETSISEDAQKAELQDSEGMAIRDDSKPFAVRQPGEEPEEEAKERERIQGIFSTQSVQKVGTGTTVRKTIQKTFWMVEELDDGVMEIQPLNTNYIPSGPKRKVAMEDLLQKFSPEPEFYVHTVFPAIQKLEKTVVKGEEHRAKGEYFSAENEFNHALKVDVENVRANFGLGLTYLERGEGNKADNIFERLVKLDAAFEEEHKHLFNEFGIKLRKNKMYEQAMIYYKRSMELARVDEHLHYNMARACFEMVDLEKTLKHLDTALKMNPNLEPAKLFRQWLEDKSLTTPEGIERYKRLKAAEADGGKGDESDAAPLARDDGETLAYDTGQPSDYKVD